MCNGDLGSVTANGTGGTPGYRYLWTPGGQTNATATGLTPNTYTVAITDSRGCTGTVRVSVTQPAVLTVTASFTHASCGLPNGSAIASVGGGTNPYTYLWNPGGNTNATATGLRAGSYTVSVTDNHHCTASASVTITQPSAVVATITATTNITCNGGNNGSATVSASGGTLPYRYQWMPGGNTNATAAGLFAGGYTVTVTDANGCTSTASTVLTQPAAMVVSIIGTPIRCLGTSRQFSVNIVGGVAPFQYLWSTGATTDTTTLQPFYSQTYSVQVTDAHGCKQSGFITFTFPVPVAVTISAPPISCSGRSATLCALATGGNGGDTYLWEPVNLTGPCITIPPVITTIYTVTVTDNCNFTATASATIRVTPPPAVNFTSNIYQGCEPLCIQFRNMTASLGGKEQYIWTFGNGDSLLTENPIYCYQKSGVYNVTLTVISDSGCSSTLSKVGMITVYPRPVAAFTLSPQPTTILSPTIQFTDKSTSKSSDIAYQWWTFGDGDSINTLENPTHTYKDTGNYCATLVVMDNKGCMDTATDCLVIQPNYSLYIPSAFTPNGDGLNEVFVPVGKYIRSFDMYIFDRWGIQLYHTNDINKGWDGTLHGKVAQEDTYIYKITVTDAEYNQHSYVGDVTLIK